MSAPDGGATVSTPLSRGSRREQVARADPSTGLGALRGPPALCLLVRSVRGRAPVTRPPCTGTSTPAAGSKGRSAVSLPAMPLSARNQIKGTVTRVTQGEAIANVEIDAGGQRIVASITTEAARELDLVEGKEVTAIIKASDVILAT